MALLDQDGIKAVIPHREPFLLVDEVLEMSDRHVVALKHVRPDEAYFRGHFPNEPIMPGVLIVEAIAQAGAVCLLSQEAYRGKTAYFGRMNNVRFRRKVLPGDTLRLEMTVDSLRGTVGKGTGRAYVGDELVCSAEMTFAVEAD